jgi:general secretion pathway protein E
MDPNSTPPVADAPGVPAPAALLRIPFSFAKRHGVLLESLEQDQALLVHREDVSVEALLEARRALGLRLVLRQVSRAEFDAMLQQAYEGQSGAAMQMMDDLDGSLDLDSIAQALPEPEDLVESEDDAPIIRLINALLTEAVKENGSDIHIEPFENRLVVRFRVDGVLRVVLERKLGVAPLVVSRIKVMAKLDIAEKRLPQDGRISIRIAGRAVDVRVSTIPSGHGERVVLRLLDKQAGRLDLEHLGMNSATRDLINELIHKPHGIILVTGPTGSGKTTTLYAGLTRLNDRTRNIMTVEDPIEYYIDGIGQTQVNARVEMTFARGLRAILRQDPDVVMVGECRDAETARMAVQASLTGHVVFSTIHANDCVGVISRLLDMQIDPFLVASAVTLSISQRLVRIACKHCSVMVEGREVLRQLRAEGVSDEKMERLGLSIDERMPLSLPTGCANCRHTGYSGRQAVFEMLEVNAAIRKLIISGNHDVDEIRRLAHESGMTTMATNGIQMVADGRTTYAELFRVFGEG